MTATAARPDIALVSMPWSAPSSPSIQLGTLTAHLVEAGRTVRAHSLFVDWTDWVATHAARPDRMLAHCTDIAQRPFSGLGEWIFAIPPWSTVDADADERFLAGQPTALADAARELRPLAAGFARHCADAILRDAPRIVGFSSTFAQTVPSLLVATLIAEASPDTAIVFGGANCEGEMGEALLRGCPVIDVVVRGYAEETAPALVEALVDGEPLAGIPGLVYREGDRVVVAPERPSTQALGHRPVPDYDEYFARVERSPVRDLLAGSIRVPFESARGCWWGAKHHCTFCGLNGQTMAFRSRPADDVYDELMTLAARHRQLSFCAVDNIIDMNYLDTLLPRLAESGVDLSLFFETKANLDREQVRMLARSGVRHIQPGIESLSTPVLRAMRKGVAAWQNIRLLKWCAEDDIAVLWNLLYGLPNEDPAEYDRMARLIPSLHHLTPPSLSPLEVARFSPYHTAPEKCGARLLGAAPFYAHVYGDEVDVDAIAYVFEHERVDGQAPRDYVAPVREAVERWRQAWRTRRPALTYERGPGFLVISDRRDEVEQRYELEGVAAALYEAFEPGRTISQAIAILQRRGMDTDDAKTRDLAEQLVAARLLYREEDRHLALATAARPPLVIPKSSKRRSSRLRALTA